MTVGSPAKGTGTYPEYAVGSLAAGDSSSFEVTFASTDLSLVPLVISWKNVDGDDYSVTKILDLSSASSSGSAAMSNSSGTVSGSSGFPQGGPPGGMGALVAAAPPVCSVPRVPASVRFTR